MASIGGIGPPRFPAFTMIASAFAEAMALISSGGGGMRGMMGILAREFEPMPDGIGKLRLRSICSGTSWSATYQESFDLAIESFPGRQAAHSLHLTT